MSNEKLSLAQEESRLIKKIKIFIDYFEGNRYLIVDILGGKTIKSNKLKSEQRDFLNSLLRTLKNAKNKIDDEIIEYSTGVMLEKSLSISDDLEYLLNQILTHKEDDEKKGKPRIFYQKRNFIKIYKMNLIDFYYHFKQMKHIKSTYTKNEFNIGAYTSPHKIEKQDIYILGYYELIALYKEHDIKKDFKRKATSLINNKFNYSLKGNKLEIFCKSISIGSETLSLSNKQFLELKNKIKTHSISISI